MSKTNKVIVSTVVELLKQLGYTAQDYDIQRLTTFVETPMKPESKTAKWIDALDTHEQLTGGDTFELIMWLQPDGRKTIEVEQVCGYYGEFSNDTFMVTILTNGEFHVKTYMMFETT